MNRFAGLCIPLLVLSVAACDININTGSGETDDPPETSSTGDAPADDDDDAGTTTGEEPPDDAPETSSTGDPGDDESSSSGDDPTGDDPTGDDPTGDDPTGDDPTGDPTGDDPTGEEPIACEDEPTCQGCGDCVQLPGEACEGVTTACADDPDCVAFVDCYNVCAALPSDAAYEACWYDECVAHWPDGADPFTDYLECVLDACGSQCS